MQHKEESRKPGGGALHPGGAGLLFLWGCPAAGSRGTGVPPIKGEAGLIDSAAGYEYVSSPTEYKNKIYPSPMQRHAEKTDRFPRTKMI